MSIVLFVPSLKIIISATNNFFGNLNIKNASNDCLIIEEALVYLECTVQSSFPSGDRTLIYAVVERGEVLQNKGLTAIQLSSWQR